MDSSSEDDDLIITLLLLRRRRLRRLRARRWWVHPINQLRFNQGAYHNLVMEMRLDEEKFYNFHRLTVQQFDHLLEQIEVHIGKMYCVREPLPSGLRLSLTLRYIAGGESMTTLSYFYRIGKSSVTYIIREVTKAIWDVLQPVVLPRLTEGDLQRIGLDFEEIWNFPNCIGAIDGKHVVCQCPANSGSRFYNYKNAFSVVLLAVCDAQYRFTYISVGSAGRECDGGIFQASTLGRTLENRTFPLPPPRSPTGCDVTFPPVLVGDAAFPLKEYLMRPYPGVNLPPEKDIFNYRLSRARRVIENTFGVFASRMRIFRKPIIAEPPLLNRIVQCAIVLHKWLRDHELNVAAGQRRYMPVDFIDRIDHTGMLEEGRWRQEDAPQALRRLPRNTARNATDEAKKIRGKFAEYFMKEGHVPWQWEKLPAHLREQYRREATVGPR